MKSARAILGAALLALTGCQSSYQAPPTAEWIAFVQSSAEPERIVLAADSDDPETIRQRHLVEAAIDRCNKSDRIEKMFPGWRDWTDYRLVRTETAATVSLPNQQFGTLYVFRFDRSTGKLETSEELLMHYAPERKTEPEQSKEPTAGEAIHELAMISLAAGAGDWVLLLPAPEDEETARQRQLVEVAIRGAEWTNWLDQQDPNWRASKVYRFRVRRSSLSIIVQSGTSGYGIAYDYIFDLKTGSLLKSYQVRASP